MRDWVTRESNRTGETVHQVLERVTKEGGGKWATIGMVCGMTGPAARNMFIKHGFEKKPIWNFDYQGVNASMLSHCNRLGLDYPSVANYKTRNKLTPAEAMTAYLEGRVKRHYWGVKAA